MPLEEIQQRHTRASEVEGADDVRAQQQLAHADIGELLTLVAAGDAEQIDQLLEQFEQLNETIAQKDELIAAQAERIAELEAEVLQWEEWQQGGPPAEDVPSIPLEPR